MAKRRAGQRAVKQEVRGSTSLARALQELSERDLTDRVVIPLFRTMYEAVDDYGGPGEHGIDLICRGTNELLKPTVAVVQIKRSRPSARAADTRSFAGLLTQLCQAAEYEVESIDGHKCLPATVYFVTPFPINTRALQTRFSAVPSLRQRRIEIVDGQLLETLLRRKLPAIVTDLCGPPSVVHPQLYPLLSNDILLQALETDTRTHVRDFFTDIDFIVGRMSAHLLVTGRFRPMELERHCDATEWANLEFVANQLAQEGGDSIVVSDGKAEIRFKQQLANWRSSSEALSKNASQLSAVRGELDQLREELEGFLGNVEVVHDLELEKEFETLLTKLSNLAQRKVGASRDGEAAVTVKELRTRLGPLGAVGSLKSATRAFRDVVRDYIRVVAQALRLERKRGTFSECEEPSYRVTINGPVLAQRLMVDREWLIRRIDQFNIATPQVKELRGFLQRCQEILVLWERVFRSRSLVRALGLRIEDERYDHARYRLSISVERVFDTGLNLLVLGEAGAGKTTSLQKYASDRIARASDDELVVFAPLGHVARLGELQEEQLSDVEPAKRVLEGLVRYLVSLDCDISVAQLESVLASGKVVLLLDALDEGMAAAPWIVEGIRELEGRYPRTQMITSCRSSTKYVQELNMISLTLMPFSDEQRGTFIQKWFAGRSTGIVRRIREHLKKHPEVAQVVKSPLLATILCVLADRKAPLPETRVALYDQRLRLLLGYYDVAKRIDRLKTRLTDRELVARKLAFGLQMKGVGVVDLESLIDLGARGVGSKLDRETVRMVIQELIDPCNVILPMRGRDMYGFGHLVYQEHLVAIELQSNRNIEIGPLMNHTWWRGALVLFAAMTDDIEWLMIAVFAEGTIRDTKGTIREMIAMRPVAEQTAYRRYLRDLCRMARADEPLLEGLDEWDDEVDDAADLDRQLRDNREDP